LRSTATPFALDLDLQPRRNWPTIAGLHLIKTLTPFCIRNPERSDTMRDQKGVLGTAIDRETRCIQDVVLTPWLMSTLCNQNSS
jgi:hypothetical protein